MSAPTCQVCPRALKPGETAYASDWKVIDAAGAHLETRYTCEDCEAAA